MDESDELLVEDMVRGVGDGVEVGFVVGTLVVPNVLPYMIV